MWVPFFSSEVSDEESDDSSVPSSPSSSPSPPPSPPLVGFRAASQFLSSSFFDQPKGCAPGTAYGLCTFCNSLYYVHYRAHLLECPVLQSSLPSGVSYTCYHFGCFKVFSSLSALRLHLLGSDQERLFCSFCGFYDTPFAVHQFRCPHLSQSLSDAAHVAGFSISSASASQATPASLRSTPRFSTRELANLIVSQRSSPRRRTYAPNSKAIRKLQFAQRHD